VLFDGSVYHMWFIGWNLEETAGGMGYATSTDAVEWTMDPGNPVLTEGEPGAWDESMRAFHNPAVIYDGSQFHMWYSGEDGQGGTHRGGYATSPDGITWTKYPDNPVLDLGPPGTWDDTSVRTGAVVLDGDTYKMWYSGWDGHIVRIGYAESTDGIEWTKHPEPVLDELRYPGIWDSRVANPSVVFDGSLYHMWYAGYDSSVGDWMVGYAFSTDGIGWNRHRDNPVVGVEGEDILSLPVVFDGSTWHGWYEVVGEGTGSVNYAISDCCPGVAAPYSQYIPAAAVAAGSEGSFFQTDVDLNNAGDQPVEYQLMWLPRGEDCSEPLTSETFTLGAGMSVRYENVLSEVFGLEPDSLGALGVLSTSPDLLLMSRTYNMPSAKTTGTYGQAMPAITTGDFIETGERRRILFASENVDLRTNVGCQSGSDATTAVYLDLYNSQGAHLGTEIMLLPPWGNDQLNRVFDDHQPVDGYVDVSTPAATRRFFCYGSVLDNVTSDPTTILPQ
jgi:hypothetical protein